MATGPILPFPHCSDNIVTWNHAVLMAAIVAGFEVDFAWMLQAVMHVRAFKTTSTYPFVCMVIKLYRSVRVTV